MEHEAKHSLTITDRKRLSLTGALRVETFTEEEIRLETNMGFIVLQGEGLHITHLDLDQGALVVEGFVSGITYKESGARGRMRGKNLFNRLLK